MQELEITWGRVLSVWWLIQWRAIAGGLITGMVVGGALGAVLAFGGDDSDQNATLELVAGGAVGVFWTVFATRMALRKKYRDFRIALLPPEGGVT
jgi:hypothetical protein